MSPTFFQHVCQTRFADSLRANSIGAHLWRKFLRLAKPSSGIVAVRVGDMLVHVDAADGIVSAAIIKYGCWEPYETELLRNLATPGALVVDAGANIGWTTLALAQQVGPDGRVHAFEPVPHNYAILSQNIATNHFQDRVLCHNLALGAELGQLTIHLDGANAGGHSIHAGAVQKVAGSVTVDVVPLDQMLTARAQPVRLIKMDTQGAEASIIAGAHKLLQEDHPIIVMEWWPFAMAQSGTRPEEMATTLAELGYQPAELRNSPIPIPASWDQILTRCDPGKEQDCIAVVALPAQK